MTRESHQLVQLAEHPDVEDLRHYDHPPASLRRWAGLLTAKAWMGSDLACFFVSSDCGDERFVLFFKASNAYRPMLDGIDMREAAIGSEYELDVFVTEHHLPIVDRVTPVRVFP